MAVVDYYSAVNTIKDRRKPDYSENIRFIRRSFASAFFQFLIVFMLSFDEAFLDQCHLSFGNAIVIVHQCKYKINRKKSFIQSKNSFH
jgi:hypothetical protein